MPYGNSMSSISPVGNMQRNAITQALMNIRNPPPQTQMPGGGIGAPTQSPIVPAGVTAGPGMPGSTPGGPQTPQAPGGMGGLPAPGAMGGLMQPPIGLGPTVGPQQTPPPQMGGAPIPPPGPVPGLIGGQPPQTGQVLGTQLPPTY